MTVHAEQSRAGGHGRQGTYYGSTGAVLGEAATALGEAGAALEAAARALRRLAALDAGRVPEASEAPPLRGAHLRQVIVEVARRGIAVDEPFYYRDLFALVEQAGHRVAGRDPLATFLTALSRAPEFAAVGGRSGLYQLAAED